MPATSNTEANDAVRNPLPASPPPSYHSSHLRAVSTAITAATRASRFSPRSMTVVRSDSSPAEGGRTGWLARAAKRKAAPAASDWVRSPNSFATKPLPPSKLGNDCLYLGQRRPQRARMGSVSEPIRAATKRSRRADPKNLASRADLPYSPPPRKSLAVSRCDESFAASLLQR